jgi:predicted  nucleic acid-binding Zn-ribbon protein
MNKLSLILGAIAALAVGAAVYFNLSLGGTISSLEGALNRAENSLQETRQRLEVATQRSKDFEDKAARFERELGGAKARATTLAQQNSMARMEIASLTRQLDDAAEAATEKDAEINRLKRELVDLRMTPEHNREEQTAALRDTIARLENEIERLQDEIASQRGSGSSSFKTESQGTTERAKTFQREILSLSENGDIVALPIGTAEGARVGLSVLLRRGSRDVARLTLTRVEGSLSLGTVDPQFGSPRSLKKGETLTIVLP